MNLLLLEDSQIQQGIAKPNDLQAEHLRSVLKSQDGDRIKLGRINGLIGLGTIRFDKEQIFFDNLVFETQPPEPLHVTLILAMPRPQMLKRVLQTVGTMGVSRLCFIQTSRVEKSFWQSPVATNSSIKKYLIMGLEQGMATQLPLVEKFQRFRPFVEDKLDEIAGDTLKFIGHPTATSPAKEHESTQELTLAIGPEGGFLEKEVEAFSKRGFQPIHLGSRILKVETAVPVLLAKLFKFEK